MRISFVFLLCWLTAWSSAQHSISFLKIPPRLLEVEKTTRSNNSALYPFDLVRGMVYMEAKLDGQAGQYILDTGAPYVVVNTIPRPEEGAEKAQSITQAVAVSYGSARTFDFAGQSRAEITLLQVDISHIERAARRQIAGLIGYEEFKDSELYLNYPGRQMGVLKAGLNRLHRTSKPLYSIPFQLDGHLPVIEVKAGGRILRLGIDTGAGANILDPEAIRALSEQHLERLATEEVQGLDQEIRRAESVVVKGLEVGELPVDDLPFLLNDLSSLRQNSDLQLDGLLGYTFLQRYKLSIDYVNKRLHVWGISDL